MEQIDIRLSILVAWTSILVGALTGLLLGIWSFGGPVPVPGWIGDYSDLPRRLLRLGHIAFFGLGILNIMLSRHLRQSLLGTKPRHIALKAMNFGNIFLPLSLFVAAVWEPAKYLMSVPAIAVTGAFLIGAAAAYTEFRDE